jgi:D-alanyl-D-alanine carboxypeptidase
MKSGLWFSIALAVLIMGTPRAHAGPALLYDPANDKVLYAEDIDRPWHPASVTKIMTASRTFEALKNGRLTLETMIPYSELANKMPASKIGLRAGSEVSVEFALKALIIKSANDIAVALAEAIGGSHDGFVAKMNATARRLGMSRTHFVNPNGLPSPEQVTTARDLALLAKAVLDKYPQHAAYWGMSSMRVGKRRLRSHNSLLRTLPGADGIKTGFICDAGFNVVASATRDGLQLIAVVLGERTPGERATRAGSLLEHGFNTYSWKVYFSAPSLTAMPVSSEVTTARSVRRRIPLGACNPRLARARARRERARQSSAARKAKQQVQSNSKLAKPKGSPASRGTDGR